jgi:hypothetical protein
LEEIKSLKKPALRNSIHGCLSIKLRKIAEIG